MKNFSFEKNKNIYIIRYKEWELCMDIEKEIIMPPELFLRWFFLPIIGPQS